MVRQIVRTVALWCVAVFVWWWVWSYSTGFTDGHIDGIAYPFLILLSVGAVLPALWETRTLVRAVVVRGLVRDGWEPFTPRSWVADVLDDHNEYVVIPAPYATEYRIYWRQNPQYSFTGCWVGEFWMLDENAQCVDRVHCLDREEAVQWFMEHARTEFGE